MFWSGDAMTRVGMAIDMTRCTGCYTCVVACQLGNSLKPGVAWTKVDVLEWGEWPHAGRAYLSHACMHCDDPPCVSVCPTGASVRHDDGVVGIQYDSCIGCGVCVAACMYGSRTVNKDDAWFVGADYPAPYEMASSGRVGVAEKCTLCRDRMEEGRQPFCVEACPTGARACGDLDDPASDINAFISGSGARQVSGTAIYYATGNYDIDIYKALVMEFGQGQDRSLSRAEEPEGNPAVIVTAGVAAAATVAGVAVSVRRRHAERSVWEGVAAGNGNAGMPFDHADIAPDRQENG